MITFVLLILVAFLAYIVVEHSVNGVMASEGTFFEALKREVYWHGGVLYANGKVLVSDLIGKVNKGE